MTSRLEFDRGAECDGGTNEWNCLPCDAETWRGICSEQFACRVERMHNQPDQLWLNRSDVAIGCSAEDHAAWIWLIDFLSFDIPRRPALWSLAFGARWLEIDTKEIRAVSLAPSGGRSLYDYPAYLLMRVRRWSREGDQPWYREMVVQPTQTYILPEPPGSLMLRIFIGGFRFQRVIRSRR